MGSCPHCGATTRANQRFCTSCGKPLTPVSSGATRTPPPGETHDAAADQPEAEGRPKAGSRRKLLRIAGIAVVAWFACLGIWAAVTTALDAKGKRASLPTAAALCEAVALPREQPTAFPEGANTPTAVMITVEPRIVTPALSVISVQYEDGEWRLAKVLDDEAERADQVKSLVCITQSRGGRSYTDGAMGYWIYWHVRVVTWPEGEVIDQERFVGGDPPSTKTGAGDRYGSKPSEAALRRWLNQEALGEALIPTIVPQGSFHPNGSVSAVVFSPDGKFLAVVVKNAVQVWDVERQTVRTFSGHTDPVRSLSFSPDSKVLASGSADKTTRLWDVATGQELLALEHPVDVSSVAFSPDSSILATATRQEVLLRDAATGEIVRTLGARLCEVGCVAFSPDGKTLAATCQLLDAARLWDVGTGEEVRTLKGHGRDLSSVAFSPDGRTLATAGRDGMVRLWDVATGEELLSLSGHTEGVVSVAFSPDGTMLASGSGDKTVRMWDTASGEQVGIVGTHTDTVSGVAFSPDGATLASGSWDGTVRLWAVRLAAP